MFNSVRHFIKNITFNSGLNREKFINNKKNINKIVTKTKTNNNNMIIIRKMTTYREAIGNNKNNNHNNNNLFYIFIMASGVYISNTFNKKK